MLKLRVSRWRKFSGLSWWGLHATINVLRGARQRETHTEGREGLVNTEAETSVRLPPTKGQSEFGRRRNTLSPKNSEDFSNTLNSAG